ncbi:small integral membrane protein 11-like [Paramormyrops kingsleyae]|uniref:Small integral membrane protein 11A-like n=1 Tax=Paramormyrops kingsleyae TaxID=1676925 RepID=A0A3B3RAL7_9TELE|nr:small integral membrane protein 11A-like [Paramormyrops kingsleyae]XP_023653509.1 small integral membrane protein 11A-like [Paramormyrops kingsleyae]
MINWKALDNVPLLFYILAAKTLLLCLAFAAVKMYQSKRAEAELKRRAEARRKLAQQTQELLDGKKED